MIPVAYFRDQEYPHGALFKEDPSEINFGQEIRQQSSGSLRFSRGSPNIAKLADLLQQGRPPMVTLEYDDGFTPFVGFVTSGKFRTSDPEPPISFSDHWWKLGKEATRVASARITASHVLIGEVLGDLIDRASAPISINLSHLKAGPPTNQEQRAERGDSFVRSVADNVGYEAYFSYEITPGRVETYLEFSQSQGVGRDDDWIEGQQLSDVELSYDFNRGATKANVYGGTGVFTGRPLSTVSYAKFPGGGGTATEFPQRITDKNILLSRAQAALDAPENVVRRMTAQLVESKINRALLGVGDVRQIQANIAFLGVPINIKGRVVAIGFHPEDGVHDVVIVETL